MKKKYIIELEDDVALFGFLTDIDGKIAVTGVIKQPYNELDIARVKACEYAKGYQYGYDSAEYDAEQTRRDAYKEGYKDGKATGNSDLEEVRKEAYDKGYDDATEEIGSDEQAIADKAYKKGLSDAWEVAKKIELEVEDQGFSLAELNDIFGIGMQDIFKTHTAAEAIAKIKAWEEKHKIKVGDEIYCVGCPDIKVCVTDIEYGNFSGFTVEHPDNSNIGHVYSNRSFAGWKKTGRHFTEIGAVLEKMREE